MNCLNKFRRCACIATFSLLTAAGFCDAKMPEQNGNFIRMNTMYSSEVTNPYKNFNKSLTILNAKRDGQLQDMTVNFGGFAIGGVNYVSAKENSEDVRTTWLDNVTLRQNAEGNNKKSASNIRINNALLGVTATPSSWATLYAELAYLPSEFNNQDINLSQALVVFGNLAENPFYGVAGKGYIPFMKGESLTGTYQTLLAMNFLPFGEHLLVGYADNGFDVTVAVARNTSDIFDAYTTNGITLRSDEANLSTVIASASYAGNYEKGSYYVGAGWNNSGPFDFDVVAEEFQGKNAVWDVNAGVTYEDFSFRAEYLAQADAWVASFGTEAQRIKPKGYDLQASWDVHAMDYDWRFALGYGHMKWSKHEDYKTTRQWNFGAVANVDDNFSLFVNYQNMKGAIIFGLANGAGDSFMPVNTDAGFNVATGLPTTHQQNNVITLGAKAVF